MKRTQSKAVKRKGAVKVPKGWRKLLWDEVLKLGDRRSRIGGKHWFETMNEGMTAGESMSEAYREQGCIYIRRNPRAARANKGRKV